MIALLIAMAKGGGHMMCQLGPYAIDAVHQGEALALLRAVPDASVDMVLTDPPYSSVIGRHAEAPQR